jgi:hypothetical protein
VCRPCCAARSTVKRGGLCRVGGRSWGRNDVARPGDDSAPAPGSRPPRSVAAPTATVRTAAPPRMTRLQSGPTLDTSAVEGARLSTHSALVGGAGHRLGGQDAVPAARLPRIGSLIVGPGRAARTLPAAEPPPPLPGRPENCLTVTICLPRSQAFSPAGRTHLPRSYPLFPQRVSTRTPLRNIPV